MSKWKFQKQKPEPERSIEFFIKGVNIPEYGTWTGEFIQTADEKLKWECVLYWRYNE